MPSLLSKPERLAAFAPAGSGTATLVGWPLALALGTAGATLWALRSTTRGA